MNILLTSTCCLIHLQSGWWQTMLTMKDICQTELAKSFKFAVIDSLFMDIISFSKDVVQLFIFKKTFVYITETLVKMAIFIFEKLVLVGRLNLNNKTGFEILL
jgi:hypothetical protein